jgi:hypothetical protein
VEDKMTREHHRVAFALLCLALILACAQAPGSPAPDNPDGATESEASLENPAPTQDVHIDRPGALPEERSGHAGDHDTSVTADQNRAVGGDRFTFGDFERPFNAESMDVYFPDLDIQDTLLYQDETWIYAVITLKGVGQDGRLAGNYAVEIDADNDGGGEWLIISHQPASTEWSTAGVQVWSDANNDVGGATTINSDAQAGDGYEDLLFDQDTGDDPDLAWARLAPDSPNTVQIAAKRALLAGDTTYMVGMWAGNTSLDPAGFDVNDHFTHEQAGAALIDLEFFYPIKAVAELDNSCRMGVGFQPSGSEPGLCPIARKEDLGCEGPVYCYNFGSQQVCYCIE